jgi:gluconate 2-dehydrogenase gamma chain
MTRKPNETGRHPRREFLKGALLLPVAISGTDLMPFRSVLAAEEQPAAGATYQPTFFTAGEWRFINAVAARLIPSNEDGPGAVDLHVPEFIDRQMETDYGHGGRWYLQGPFHPEADAALGYQLGFAPRELYRAAIDELDEWCRTHHGEAFADLSTVLQDDVLTRLQQGQVELPSVKATEFFGQVLANVKEGYFADPMYGGNYRMGGWKMIGFPGARADFKDWSAQPGKPYPLPPVSIQGEKA